MIVLMVSCNEPETTQAQIEEVKYLNQVSCDEVIGHIIDKKGVESFEALESCTTEKECYDMAESLGVPRQCVY